MLVLVFVAAAIVVVLAMFALGLLLGRRRSEAQPSVTEAQAREHSAPLTTAILSRSGDRTRTKSSTDQSSDHTAC